MPLDVEVDEAFLSRFAFKSTSPRHPRSPPSRHIPAARKDLGLVDLPDTQLTQLSRCVVCRLRWTSKKSAKQKRAHIEQCAKKNAFAKDTIRSLVKQEIAPVSPTSGASEATLMDSVVPAGASKKPRRQQVVPTVRSLPETRESILDRAKDILGPANAQPEPHLTQQFGQSALAYRMAKRPALVNESADEPPLTQPFGTSALHQRTIASGHVESGASMFAQDTVSSNDRVRTFVSPVSTPHIRGPKQKRPASPPLDGSAKSMRQRLQ